MRTHVGIGAFVRGKMLMSVLNLMCVPFAHSFGVAAEPETLPVTTTKVPVQGGWQGVSLPLWESQLRAPEEILWLTRTVG